MTTGNNPPPAPGPKGANVSEQAKHTPGPWNFDGHGINHEGERIAKVSHERCENHDMGRRLSPRFEADSLLIAAAPDMEEALDFAYQALTDRNGAVEDQEAIEKILAALAKARPSGERNER